jgi:catechol 2,3-dioxygenase-like lactoylglutathione lyase family enzyme
MKNKLMFGVLVKNYDEAIDFYTKKLGFVESRN